MAKAFDIDDVYAYDDVLYPGSAAALDAEMSDQDIAITFSGSMPAYGKFTSEPDTDYAFRNHKHRIFTELIYRYQGLDPEFEKIDVRLYVRFYDQFMNVLSGQGDYLGWLQCHQNDIEPIDSDDTIIETKSVRVSFDDEFDGYYVQFYWEGKIEDWSFGAPRILTLGSVIIHLDTTVMTATPTPVPTATPLPPTPVPTATSEPPTNTPVPTNTTPPTDTPITPTFTHTHTPITPVPTDTPVPTSTFTHTATPVPPSPTPVPTSTPTFTPLPPRLHTPWFIPTPPITWVDPYLRVEYLTGDGAVVGYYDEPFAFMRVIKTMQDNDSGVWSYVGGYLEFYGDDLANFFVDFPRSTDGHWVSIVGNAISSDTSIKRNSLVSTAIPVFLVFPTYTATRTLTPTVTPITPSPTVPEPVDTNTPTVVPTDTATEVPPSPTPIPSNTPTVPPSPTPVITPGEIPDTPTLVPTEVPTGLPTSTPVPSPTLTWTPVPSDTPTLPPTPEIPPTKTFTPTPTYTPIPPPTPTHTWTPTNTPLAPTPTIIPTNTPRPVVPIMPRWIWDNQLNMPLTEAA